MKLLCAPAADTVTLKLEQDGHDVNIAAAVGHGTFENIAFFDANGCLNLMTIDDTRLRELLHADDECRLTIES